MSAAASTSAAGSSAVARGTGNPTATTSAAGLPSDSTVSASRSTARPVHVSSAGTAPSPASSSVVVCTNIVDGSGRGAPSRNDATSRSTPRNWSAISAAEP